MIKTDKIGEHQTSSVFICGKKLLFPRLASISKQALRSCLKTQDFARETHESDEKKKNYFDFILIFREFSVFRGQKIVFKQLLRIFFFRIFRVFRGQSSLNFL